VVPAFYLTRLVAATVDFSYFCLVAPAFYLTRLVAATVDISYSCLVAPAFYLTRLIAAVVGISDFLSSGASFLPDKNDGCYGWHL
jgi:hypothetical protein